MARIQGVDLPRNKRIEYALPYVFGIGLKTGRDILNKLKINFDIRVKDLSEDQVSSIQKEVSSNYRTEGDLRKEHREDILRLQTIGSYRGERHKRNLPCRGQKTKTNARVNRPKKNTVAGKKKATKK